MKPATEIERWDDWPADVVDKLRLWNRKRDLSFRGTGDFRCGACGDQWKGNRYGNAILSPMNYGRPICDPCLIAVARRAP